VGPEPVQRIPEVLSANITSAQIKESLLIDIDRDVYKRKKIWQNKYHNLMRFNTVPDPEPDQ
jgi:hypothetical protein